MSTDSIFLCSFNFIGKYGKWSKYQPKEQGVLTACTSMYGDAESAVQTLVTPSLSPWQRSKTARHISGVERYFRQNSKSEPVSQVENGFGFIILRTIYREMDEYHDESNQF